MDYKNYTSRDIGNILSNKIWSFVESACSQSKGFKIIAIPAVVAVSCVQTITKTAVVGEAVYKGIANICACRKEDCDAGFWRGVGMITGSPFRVVDIAVEPLIFGIRALYQPIYVLSKGAAGAKKLAEHYENKVSMANPPKSAGRPEEQSYVPEPVSPQKPQKNQKSEESEDEKSEESEDEKSASNYTTVNTHLSDNVTDDEG